MGYIEKWKEKIEKERKVQKEQTEYEILHLRPEERAKMGKTLLNAKVSKKGRLLDLYLYNIYHPQVKDSQIKTGDVVLLTPEGGEVIKDSIEGTVYEKYSQVLVVALTQEIEKGEYRVDLYYSDITFKRMEKALENIPKPLMELLLMKREPKQGKVEVDTPLNEWQNEAVGKALGSELLLLHGPPGTGKTTTLVQIIREFVKRGKKVLASADTNVAVDNMAEKLEDLNIVRIGNPARVSKTLLEQTLSYKLYNHPQYPEIEKLYTQIQNLKSEQSHYIKPVPSMRRGLEDEDILWYAREGMGTRGITPSQMKSMAKWIELQRRISYLAEQIKVYKEALAQEILKKADVVLATNSGTYSEEMETISFDVAVVDEASQATEPSVIMPLTKARQWVLAGDHKQLPPVVLSEDPELKVSLFERWSERFPTHMLRIQYRMNKEIMEFPSRKFYEGKLIAHSSVKNIRLSDIADIPKSLDKPIVFLDIRGEESGRISKKNVAEVQSVKEYVEMLLRYGVQPEQIGVITPYKEQKDVLQREVKVEVNTVDGFQGREKEVILISLVRANPKAVLGFIKDERRLNVAITRAKRKVVLFGNKATLYKHPLYRELIDYIESLPNS